MGRKKTYAGVSMSNLNTSEEEYRYAVLADWNAELNHINYPGVYIMDNQTDCAYVQHRNYIRWAENYSYASYNDTDTFGNLDSTYNEIIGMSSPSVSFAQSFTSEQINEIVKEKCGISLDTVTLKNQTIEVDAIDSAGNITTVSITTDIIRKPIVSVQISYVGGYDLETLCEAYLYEHGDDYVSSWFGYGIVSGEECYNIAAGDSGVDIDYNETLDDVESVLNPEYDQSTDEGTESALSGSSSDAWVYFGYNTEEYHEDQFGNSYTESVFNQEEDVYIALEDWVQSKVPNYTSDTSFYILAGYVYYEDTIDAYTTSDSYILLDTSGNPQKVEGETMVLSHHYTYTFEDYQSTYTKTYSSRVDLDNISFFSLVLDNNSALEDSLLAQTTEKCEPLDLYFSPPIAYKRNKTWVTTNDYWTAIFTKAEKKASGDGDTYSEMMDSIQESATDSVIAWVYHMWGLPTNMCQLCYCARYAIAFFKVHCISDYKVITDSYAIVERSVSGRSWTIYATNNDVNYQFQYGFSSLKYVTGLGMCPAPGYSEVRSGEGGACTYQGTYCIWSQRTSDYWEYILISGYETKFKGIKGKTRSTGSDGWLDAIWEVEDVTRNYSTCYIPISKTVAGTIAIADATDIMQYSGLIGVTWYKVVKKKWYMVVIQVILIIITVVLLVVSVIYPPLAAVADGTMTLAQALAEIAIGIAISVAVGYVFTLSLIHI